jgi:hypothetical protein
VIVVFLGNDDKLRLRKAVVLFAFLQIVLMLKFQQRLSQMVTPRYLAFLLKFSAMNVIWFLYFLPLPGYVDHLTFVWIEVHLPCMFPFLEVIKVFRE